MRINDWSSDVCSSDRKVLLRAGQVDLGLLQLVLRGGKLVLRHRAAFVGALVALQVALRGGAADLGLLHHLARGGARSEEHTSELQSLMRISYAVLCLKKKKQKNYQQYLIKHLNIKVPI